jgi:hypothetical protein
VERVDAVCGDPADDSGDLEPGAKGIYGEKLWLKERDRVPPDHLRVLRLSPACAWAHVPVGAAGFVLLVYGLLRLEVWPTAFGAALIVLAQLWRIDRLVVFYEGTR